MARPKVLGELVDACLEPAVARQGFSGADIIVSWPEIVGERLAAASVPLKIDWPRRAAGMQGEPVGPGALVVRTESAFALELQHLAPVIVERVNGFYGWRCVSRLVLKQGPVRRPAARKPAARPPSPEERRRVGDATAPVDEPGLRSALHRLGEAIVTQSGDAPDGHPGKSLP
jgi:hypothetical protein